MVQTLTDITLDVILNAQRCSNSSYYIRTCRGRIHGTKSAARSEKRDLAARLHARGAARRHRDHRRARRAALACRTIGPRSRAADAMFEQHEADRHWPAQLSR